MIRGAGPMTFRPTAAETCGVLLAGVVTAKHAISAPPPRVWDPRESLHR